MIAFLCAVLHRIALTRRTRMLETVQFWEGREAEAPEGPPAPHVLIAVDETPGARRTLESGLAHAAAHGAQVTIVHVVAPRRWRVGRFGPVRAVPMRVGDPHESPVLRDARRVAFRHGLCPRVELVAADDVDAVILGFARRVHAATIVVGASRPEGLAAPLGVCQGVLRRAPVPIVVVPA
jgi:nucleotide-binding universal stress UspA family protein